MRRPLAYLAGPYSHPDPVTCTREALAVAARLRAHHPELVLIVPHLSLFDDLVHHRPYEEWIADDLEVVARCDVVIRMLGRSSGADREEDHAVSLGIPVVYVAEPGAVDGWLAGWPTYVEAER